jgi:hypothetical protein
MKSREYLPIRARMGTVDVYAQNIVNLCEQYKSGVDSPALKSLTRRATGKTPITSIHMTMIRMLRDVPISAPKIPLNDDLAPVLFFFLYQQPPICGKIFTSRERHALSHLGVMDVPLSTPKFPSSQPRQPFPLIHIAVY